MRWARTAVMATMALGTAAGCVAEKPETAATASPSGAASPALPSGAAGAAPSSGAAGPALPGGAAAPGGVPGAAPSFGGLGAWPGAPAAGSAPGEAAAPWVGTWAAAVQPGGRSFERQTLRQIVHTSIGGGAVRVRLSHAYGTSALTVSSVHVAIQVRGSAVDPATSRAVTFGGATSVTIPAGGSVVSDEVAFAAPADRNVAISAYLPGKTGPSTRHAVGVQHNYVSAGDQSAAANLTGATTTTSYFFLAGLDVRNAAAEGAVVAFGASITDGLGSTVNANRRWPDLLSDRLRESGRDIGVLNAGISGNRLTADTYGESAPDRFERDVLQQPGARWVIISDDAINDLGNASGPASELIDELRKLIRRGKEAGLGVVCSTLTPYRGAGYWTRAGEEGRARVNAFIRGGDNGCDAVLDLDAATHDPEARTRYLPKYDSGDHLHPSDAGMRAIAGAVNLTWF